MPSPFLLAITLALFLAPPIGSANEESPQRPNYKQALKYSSEFLRQRTYSTSIRPGWIGESDRFWYSYRTSEGTSYYLVDAEKGHKELLFDHDLMAARLSEALRVPMEAHGLSLSQVSIEDDGSKMTFVVEKRKFAYDFRSAELKDLGEAPERSERGTRRGFRRSRGSFGQEESSSQTRRTHRSFSPDHSAYVFLKGHDLYFVEASDEFKEEIAAIEERLKKEKEEKEKAKEEGTDKGDEQKKEEETDKDKENSKEDKGKENRKDEGDEDKGNDDKGEGDKKDGDSKDEENKGEDEKKSDETEEGDDSKKSDGDKKGENEESSKDEERKDRESDERHKWAEAIDEDKEAIRLSQDGEEDYEFSQSRQRGRRGRGQSNDEEPADPERKRRPSVQWSEDGTSFYVNRSDSRGIAELYLVNSLANPRPTLEKYKYPMPGEEKIRRRELHVFDRTRQAFYRVQSEWRDESYQNVHWGPDGSELRFLRRDRLLRNVEFCALNVRDGVSKTLLEDGFERANISTQSIRYIRDRKQFIWWSERSGWGHFYLYDRDGNLINPITSGCFRASRIVEIDEDKGLLFFRGNGREKLKEGGKENVYYEHLYRVHLDGTGLTLLDRGNANHRSSLSPSGKYLVDNCSRVDMAPLSILRNEFGDQIMVLEEADLSRLYECGWKMPETFVVKAADGVTDLFGNMWKPFDFDAKKKYPIIVEVYPGPQTEGVTHTFSSNNSRQQLAQVGFIVVQIGHRGGTPGRSKAYHSHGYFNLRDYGLADKKAGLENLAARYPFMDIERVGIYGHSGGGFMTAAAMMKEPYNRFFKVGVSSAGNHDNNIYNNSWAERYHGLKEVAVKEEEDRERRGRRRRGEGRTRDMSRSGATYEEESEGEKDKGKETDNIDDEKKDDSDEKKEDEKKEDEKKEDEKKTRFEIEVPTTAELAENLRGHLLLVHGEMDNNVHPANTMRLVDALIKANKRFDMLILPGKRHGFGDYNTYFRHVQWEYFARYLIGDELHGADILEK